jgi:hypothetical protein
MQELSFKANNQFSKSVMMEFLQLLAGLQYRGQLSLVQGAEEVIQLEMSIWTSLCWPGPESIRKFKHLEQSSSGVPGFHLYTSGDGVRTSGELDFLVLMKR